LTAVRLPAAERRAALIKAAARIFSRGSYRGTTTAEIARAAGVTEPVLYRHFASKRELYLACVDEAWRRVRAIWDEALASESDPARWLSAIGYAYLAVQDDVYLVDLWVQALTEAGDDPEIARHLREHMLEVHAAVRDLIRRSQAAGGVVADRDSDAEAWIVIALGLLSTVGRRLGGVVGHDDLEAVFASRRCWMTGRD